MSRFKNTMLTFEKDTQGFPAGGPLSLRSHRLSRLQGTGKLRQFRRALTPRGIMRSRSGQRMTRTNARPTSIRKPSRILKHIYPNITVNLRLYTDYGKIYNDVITNIATNTTPNVCITYPDHIATYLTGTNVVVPLRRAVHGCKLRSRRQ